VTLHHHLWGHWEAQREVHLVGGGSGIPAKKDVTWVCVWVCVYVGEKCMCVSFKQDKAVTSSAVMIVV